MVPKYCSANINGCTKNQIYICTRYFSKIPWQTKSSAEQETESKGNDFCGHQGQDTQNCWMPRLHMDPQKRTLRGLRYPHISLTRLKWLMRDIPVYHVKPKSSFAVLMLTTVSKHPTVYCHRWVYRQHMGKRTIE